jgi:AraC family transcriptional activator of tynA and feaB
MAVVLDTDLLAPDGRPDAIEALFDTHEVPQLVRYAAPPERVRYRMELFGYGPGIHLLYNYGTGLIIDRTARHVRQGAPGQLALFMGRTGVGYLSRGDVSTVFHPGDIGVIDTMRPYAWRQSEQVEHFVLIVDNVETGLHVEQLLAGGDRITHSPLYGLMRAHFIALCDGAADLAPEAMHAVGRSTAQVVRAAILTAVDGPDTAQCLDETLFTRMATYADMHLHDPELTAAQIAAEHFVSVRYLYKVWDRATGQSPHRWIMSRRLERAGTLLAGRHRSVLPINWVARQCGFTNMSHFSRRFRECYGLSPRDWSVSHQQG